MEEKRKKYENWIRVVVMIDYAGKQLCSEILHKNYDLPTDGGKLYYRLERYKNKMQYKIHQEILCPLNKVIDEKKFDLLIYAIVIDSVSGGKYKELLDPLGDIRNKIFHMEDKAISIAEFETLWEEAGAELLKHGFDVNSLNFLKTCNLYSSEEWQGK